MNTSFFGCGEFDTFLMKVDFGGILFKIEFVESLILPRISFSSSEIEFYLFESLIVGLVKFLLFNILGITLLIGLSKPDFVTSNLLTNLVGPLALRLLNLLGEVSLLFPLKSLLDGLDCFFVDLCAWSAFDDS